MAELRAGFDHLPLGDVIRHLTGVDLQLYQDQLAHTGLDDPFWSPLDYSALLKDWTVPTLLVDGWHDYPLPRVLEDYAALRTSAAPVGLRIGAGGHLGAAARGDDRRSAGLVRHLSPGRGRPASPPPGDNRGPG